MVFAHRDHATRAHDTASYSPLLALAPWLPAAAGTLALGYVAGLSGRDLLVAPLSLLLFGLLQGGRSFRARVRQRSSADAWIEQGHDSLAGWYGWRIAELTAPRERRLLARSLRAVVADLSSSRITSAAPLNRRALRPYAGLLVELADRLDALERPVSPAGVLCVQRLITRPDSPLYAGGASEERAWMIRAALDRLEVR